jgi:hypothetical protein
VSPTAIFIVLLGCAFLAYGVKASFDSWRLYKAGLGRVDREYDMKVVAQYFRGVADEHPSLPDRSWADLDLDVVFQRLDRTVSWPGQHLLYARMRREDLSFDALRKYDLAVTRLADDEGLRTHIRWAVRPLAEQNASRLPALFTGALPALPVTARLTPLLTLAAVVMILMVPWHPVMIMGVLVITVANLFVRVSLQDRIDPFLPALRSLQPMLACARTLRRLDVPELSQQSGALSSEMARLEWIGRATRWLAFEAGPDLAGAIYTYINLLLLADVSAFAWSVEAIRAKSATIRAMYEALGELDAMTSVAIIRSEDRKWCRPVFVAACGRALDLVAITHPVLGSPVANSLCIEGQNLLLTGSNMSGKSTFVRTLGVNAVLAATIHTVFATTWRAPRLVVRTSIGRSDSLVDGTSYYRAEVDAVGALFTGADGRQRLILIDELFRGTNSIERIAAAQAVLAELDRGDDIVVVATHDVELLELLPTYMSLHFREEVQGGLLTFDYRLHPGASSTRNALAILELAGFPAEVVAESRRTAASLEKRLRINRI